MIELHNWPKDALDFHKNPENPWPVLRLLWPTAPFGPSGFDVDFSEETFEYLGGRTPEKTRLRAPWRLNGLSKVSALESLAGARMEDSVEVRLKNPSLRKSSGQLQLVIEEEPVQIAGTHYCLLRFSSMDSEGRLIGRHWCKSNGDFSGKEQQCIVPNDVPRVHHENPLLQVKHTTVDKIWNSPLNRYGWYAYGHFEGKDFHLDGLLPRRVHEFKPDNLSTGIAEGRRFIESEQWDPHALDHAQRSYRSMLISPKAEHIDDVAAHFRQNEKRFLVLHIFGSWGRNGVEEQPNLKTGHFSFGVAHKQKCPFTGEDRFQIEYEQVYGTNDQGIVSGSVDWAEYMGGLRRGWMYLRPAWDILVDFEPLTRDYQWQGKTISPLKIICQELSRIHAAYRVGMGSGCAIVTVLNSCVQDSTQGLFRAMETIFADESEPWSASSQYPELTEFRNWAESENEDEQARQWRALCRWYDGRGTSKIGRSLSREFFRVSPAGLPLGRVWRSDWQDNLEDSTTFVRAEHHGGLLDMLDAFKASRNSMMPRRTQDTHAKLFLEHGARLWVFNTVQTGGIIECQFARAPEKLNWKKMRQLFGKTIPNWGK